MRHLSLLLAVLVAGAARAQVPAELPVALRLEEGGAARTSPASLTLGLYDAASGGSALVEETDVVTPDSGGLAATTFGDGGGLDAGVLARGGRFLEVQVDGGAALAPRLELLPVPFARRAARAEALLSRELWVSAGGSSSENGARLQAVVAGLDSPTASRPYVIWLAPGHYDLGSGGLALPAHVSLRGVASVYQQSSAVMGPTLSAFTSASRTLALAGDNTVEGLRVLAGASPASVAIQVNGSDVTLQDVQANASCRGTSAIAVQLTTGAGEVEILSSSMVAEEGTASGCLTVALDVDSPSGHVDVLRSWLQVEDTNPNGGETVAVRHDDDTFPPMRIRDCRIFAANADALGSMVGVLAEGTEGVDIAGCQFELSGAGSPADASSIDAKVRIGFSRLEGNVAIAGSGSVCGNHNFDSSYSAVTLGSCP